MTALIGKEDAAEIGRHFRSRLVDEIGLLLFTSKRGCIYCTQTKQLLGEIASLSDRIRLEVLDRDEGSARADELEVEYAPTTVITGASGARLYYLGMPAGRQLRSLIEDVIDVSRGRTDMDEETRAIIGRVSSETVIKVFVTTFCPYSPLVVRSAHRFALENPRIRALMIETAEFPELAKKYDVIGVPRTVINERVAFDGAPSEKAFAEKVLEASMSSGR